EAALFGDGFGASAPRLDPESVETPTSAPPRRGFGTADLDAEIFGPRPAHGAVKVAPPPTRVEAASAEHVPATPAKPMPPPHADVDWFSSLDLTGSSAEAAAAAVPASPTVAEPNGRWSLKKRPKG